MREEALEAATRDPDHVARGSGIVAWIEYHGAVCPPEGAMTSDSCSNATLLEYSRPLNCTGRARGGAGERTRAGTASCVAYENP